MFQQVFIDQLNINAARCLARPRQTVRWKLHRWRQYGRECRPWPSSRRGALPATRRCQVPAVTGSIPMQPQCLTSENPGKSVAICVSGLSVAMLAQIWGSPVGSVGGFMGFGLADVLRDLRGGGCGQAGRAVRLSTGWRAGLIRACDCPLAPAVVKAGPLRGGLRPAWTTARSQLGWSSPVPVHTWVCVTSRCQCLLCTDFMLPAVRSSQGGMRADREPGLTWGRAALALPGAGPGLSLPGPGGPGGRPQGSPRQAGRPRGAAAP